MRRILQKPKAEGQLQLTERDRTLIRAAYNFRVYTTSQARRFTDSKGTVKLNKRLRELWAHDYLDRPKIQWQLFAYGDERPVVHALGQRGAEWLAKNDGVRFPDRKGWRTANRLKSSTRLEHRLGVTDTMLHFRADAISAEGVRLIYPSELLARVPGAERRRSPHRLPTEITLRDGTCKPRATDPDYTFALGKRSDNGEEKRALLFLEWDNSTEDFAKTNPNDSAILQKDRAYADIYERRLHTKLYSFKYFRRLFVVNGPAAEDRMQKMLHLYQCNVSDAIPPGVFLYTTMKQLQHSGPISDIWLDGRGKHRRLLEKDS